MPLNQYKWFSDWKSVTGAMTMIVALMGRKKGFLSL
jgi:hypothetical protein